MNSFSEMILLYWISAEGYHCEHKKCQSVLNERKTYLKAFAYLTDNAEVY